MARRIILLLLSLVVLVNGDECDVPPSCGASDPTIWISIPNPEDCSSFYMCFAGTPFGPNDCPEGQKYDINTKGCKAEEEANCINCLPKGKCNYVCPATNTKQHRIPDYTDCSIFYECMIAGITEILKCNDPAEPYYDDEMQKCTSDESKCCNPCSVQCTIGDDRIPDPLDCKSFYKCDGVTDGEPEEHITCGLGYFDPKKGSCSEDASCSQPDCGQTQTSKSPTDSPEPPIDTPEPPTDTPKPPTDTPGPPTDTPEPPIDTPEPPTDTPEPPTDTPKPPTDTPKPPTDTPKPPTDTPEPPTDTPKPPTDTPEPPTDTPEPPTVTTTPTITTTPDNGGCLTSMMCTDYGEFPVCSNQCSPKYFYCAYGVLPHPAEIKYCMPSGTVLDPGIMMCVEPDRCDYPIEPFRW